MSFSSSDNCEYSSCVEESSIPTNSCYFNKYNFINQLEKKVIKEIFLQDPPCIVPSTSFYGVTPDGRISIRTDSKQETRTMSMFFNFEQYVEIRDSIQSYTTNLLDIEQTNIDQMLMYSLLWERVKSVLEIFKFANQENVHEFMQVIF